MRLGGRNKRPLGERAAHAREHGGNAAGQHDRDGLKRQFGKSLLLFETCGLQHAGTWITIASGRHLAVGHSGSGWRRTLQLRGCEASARCGGIGAASTVTTRHFNARRLSTLTPAVQIHQFTTCYQFNFDTPLVP